MTKYYNDTRYAGYRGFGRSPKKNGVATWLKAMCWILGSLIVIIVGAWIWILCYFSPHRISELVKKEAAQYIDGRLEMGDLHYTLFSTFPELVIEVDSVRLVSNSLNNLPDSVIRQLPSDASLLFEAARIHAAINIRDLMKDKINLSQVEINGLFVNPVVVNDSLNNFNIFPPLPKKKMKIPEIKTGIVRLGTPININFTDLEQQLQVKADLSDFELTETTDGFYDLDFGMKLTVDNKIIPFTSPLPVRLKGMMAFTPDPFQITARDLKLILNPLGLNLNLDIAEKEERYVLNSFGLNLDIKDMIELMDILPPEIVTLPPAFGNIAGHLPLDLDVRVDSPYIIPDSLPSSFSFDLVPALTASVSIGNANVSYRVNKKETINVDDIRLSGELKYDAFNLDESYFRISGLKLFSEGIDLNLTAEGDDIFGEEPLINVMVEGSTNLAQSVSPLLTSEGMKMKGACRFESEIALGVKNIARGALENISIKGKFSSPKLTLEATRQNLNFAVAGTSADWSLFVPLIENASVGAAKIKVDLRGDKININSAGASAEIGKMNLQLDGRKESTTSGDVKFSLGSVTVSSQGTLVDLSGVYSEIKTRLLSTPNTFYGNCSTEPANGDEAILMSRIDMTPMWLIPQAPAPLAALLTMTDTQASLKIDAGRFDTPAYLATNLFSNLDLTTDFDNLDINSIKFTSDDTSGSLNGHITGLASFLASGEASLLKTGIEIDFDNVDINRLSGAYYKAVEKLTGKPYDFTMPPQGPYTKADSICVLIPRNIEADVKLRSRSAEYMGYKFSPLSTDILVKGGDATLSRLTIGAPYCTVAVDWTYATSAIDSIGMFFHADLTGFDFTDFFKVFPQLTDKAPEIRNLSGLIYVTADAGFRMFPSMFMNPPSIYTKFNLHGKDLKFAREGKIEKITHLMGIKGEGPIAISGLDIFGSVHDNLVLVNPFKINFGDYQIGVAGANNFAGNMYYHLALEKSPLHLPFAVNLVGSFSHPEIRFGGTEVKDGREREIASDLNEHIDVNIMTNLHRGWIMFVEEAAKYDLKR